LWPNGLILIIIIIDVTKHYGVVSDNKRDDTVTLRDTTGHAPLLICELERDLGREMLEDGFSGR
jgi:hypothetical protein